jgi:hypothetical protein
MKSISRRFSNLEEKRPDLSSITNFAGAVKYQGFSADTIHRWFGKLVETDDYDRRDKRALLRGLVELSNPVRTTENRGIDGSLRVLKAVRGE